MAKILKGISLGLVLAMLLSVSVFAASPSVGKPSADVDKEARTVVVSGSVADSVEGQQVVVLVIKSEASLASISDDDIAYIDQVSADSDGKYSFSFGIDESKGDRYTAYIGGTGVTKTASANISFAAANNPGDCDGDNDVDFDDYMFVINRYGLKSTDEGYDANADFSGNNEVDFDDYMVIINNYGKVY